MSTEDAVNEQRPTVPPTDSTPDLPPPNFTPFFTILFNTLAASTHHPRVQYIFSDDPPDSDPVTAAALQVLDPPSPSTKYGEERGVKERFVLLDMEATGTKVLAAQSMSEDWAVTATELGPAPTWDRDGQEKEGLQEGRGMMLRIKGVEVGKEAGQEKGKEAGIGGPDWEEKRLEELVEFYERRMVELRRVVNAGVGIGD